jgi:hypothetical protein
MNLTKFAAAVVIFGAFFATAPLSAQGILPDPNGTEPVDTVELDEADGTGAPGIRNPDDGDDGACGGQLEMRVENSEVFVSRGRAGDRVALLIGMQEADYELPGGARLRLEPVFVLAVGEFDEAGEYRWRISGDTSESEPISIKIQAVSMDENGCFSASGMWQLEYHGASGQFDGRRLSLLELESQGYGDSAVAARRSRLA